MLSIVFLYLFHITFGSATPQSLHDEITNLPGQPPVSFKQYSGYITLNRSSNASMFYWYQECVLGTNKCPLFLWTNGGPGCSGLMAGLTEQGAFRILSNGTLKLNDYSWNKLVNIVYIEQPIGVGYSHSNNINDYYSGDESSAQGMYEFLQGFYKVFPETQPLDFYISSESYGGHYAPMFAKYIVDHDTTKSINFKGFIVGNPLTDQLSNQQGHFGTLYGHQLISYPLFTQWKNMCNQGTNHNATCQQLTQAMNTQVQGLFNEGLDFPICLYTKDKQKYDEWYDTNYYAFHAWKRNKFFMDKIYYGTFGEMPPIGYKFGDNNPPFDCLKDYETIYLNRADVKQALHVYSNVIWPWVPCTDRVIYNGSDPGQPMQPVYQYLIDGGYNLHITIYSGDNDANCATMGAQQWIYNMSWIIEKGWSQWMYDSGKNGEQLAGYYVLFKDAISFVTVHSSGHEVPFFRPNKAFQVLQKYLSGEF
eukprot:179470_1